MPLYDYRCTACKTQFERLVRASSVPNCPDCGSTSVERLVSLPAPQGTSKAIIASARKAAAAEGHFSNFSRAERAKIGK